MARTQIPGSLIKDGTLTDADLAPNSVGTEELIDNAITGSKIADGVITNSKVASNAAIDLSKLAINPLDRANHTGTQSSSTISDFNASVGQIALLKSNNLSDCSNTTTARTNIGAAKSGDNTDITSLTSPTGVLSISGKLSVDSSNNYAKLTVYNNSYDWTIGIEDPRDTYGHWIRWTENGTEQWVLGALGTGAGVPLGNAFALKSGSPIAWRLVITQSGKVGINTTNPQSPLYVVGDITSTTNITANNNLIAVAGTVIGVRSSDVSSGSQSLIYFNSIDNQVKLWNGSSLTILG